MRSSRREAVTKLKKEDIDYKRLDVLAQFITPTGKIEAARRTGATRKQQVQVVLDNPDGRIKSGMFVRAEFARGDREALVVPSSAVIDRSQLRGLFVVDGEGLARLRWVRLGRNLDDGFEVLSGLAPGERYVVTPPAALTDGSPVETR